MSEIRKPTDPAPREPLTEDGEPIMAPAHDSDKEYFHEVTVDRMDFPGGEVGTRVNLFRVAGQKRRNTKRANYG
jgi:hypothetical protein